MVFTPKRVNTKLHVELDAPFCLAFCKTMRLSLACAFIAGPECRFRLSVSRRKNMFSVAISQPVATLGTPASVSSGMGRIFLVERAGSALHISKALHATAPVFFANIAGLFSKAGSLHLAALILRKTPRLAQLRRLNPLQRDRFGLCRTRAGYMGLTLLVVPFLRCRWPSVSTLSAHAPCRKSQVRSQSCLRFAH